MTRSKKLRERRTAPRLADETPGKSEFGPDNPDLHNHLPRMENQAALDSYLDQLREHNVARGAPESAFGQTPVAMRQAPLIVVGGGAKPSEDAWGPVGRGKSGQAVSSDPRQSYPRPGFQRGG